MNIHVGLLTNIVAAIMLFGFDQLFNYLITKSQQWKKGLLCAKYIIYLLIVCALFYVASRPEQFLSIQQISTTCSYNSRSGFALTGSYSGLGNNGIFVLGRKIDYSSPQNQNEVWIVLAEALSIDTNKRIWSARLDFHLLEKNLQVGDIIQLIVIMSDKRLKPTMNYDLASLKQLASCRTLVHEVQLREVL